MRLVSGVPKAWPGPPARCQLSHPFLGEGSPTEIDKKEKHIGQQLIEALKSGGPIVDEILHHFQTMVETTRFVGIYVGESNHSMASQVMRTRKNGLSQPTKRC